MSRWLAPLLLLSFALTACAAPLTHVQPAQAVGKGNWQLAATGGMTVATSALDIVDVGLNTAQDFRNRPTTCTADDTSTCLAASEFRPLARALYAAGLAAPVAAVTELSVHYGLSDTWDVGGRLSTGTQRLDVDYQFLAPPEGQRGWYGLGSFSYSHQGAQLPPGVDKILEFFDMADFSRHNFDLAAALGMRLSNYGWFTFGGRYLLSRYALDLRPSLGVVDDVTNTGPNIDGIVVHSLPKTDEGGWSHTAGAFAHLIVGYKYVYVGLELSLAWSSTQTMLLGRTESLGDLTIQPSLSLLTRF